MESTNPSASGGAAPDDCKDLEPPTLRSHLGVGSIVFSVIAWAAPLLVVVGLMPSMISFAGYGIVAGFAVTTVILILFSVGYGTLTRFVDRPGAFYAYITAGLGREAGLGGAFIAILGYLLHGRVRCARRLRVPGFVPRSV